VRETDGAIIGRATGTFALDIYSRAILGFSVSLEAASTLTVATCLEHACLPKDRWLSYRGLGRVRWPMYGKPVTLEYDQGSENEAIGIQRGLKIHAIKSKVRAKGHPEHHGHIERLIGTMMQKLHELPGTTFSNVNERGEAEPDKFACLTLQDLEAVLTISIDTYNHSMHSSTGERPIDRYLGYFHQPGLADADRIPPTLRADCLLDFLPFERRELRRTGVRLFWVDYSSVDLLPLWQRDNQKAKKRVVVYDPRSLKEVWVADEVSDKYIKVPYRIPHPDMTLAESADARINSRLLKVRDRTEKRLFDNLAAIQTIIAKAKSTTTRRKAERTVQARRISQQTGLQPSSVEERSSPGANPNQPAWASTEIIPFIDVETL
jgi:putative transposase